MNGVALDFPDDGGASYVALVAALPEKHALAPFRGEPLGWFRLGGLAANDQLYLKMAVAVLITPANEPYLNAGELLVPFDQRDDVERALISCGGRRGVWTVPHRIDGATEVVAAFEALWAARVVPLLCQPPCPTIVVTTVRIQPRPRRGPEAPWANALHLRSTYALRGCKAH
jgi:hypothetical protein